MSAASAKAYRLRRANGIKPQWTVVQRNPGFLIIGNGRQEVYAEVPQAATNHWAGITKRIMVSAYRRAVGLGHQMGPIEDDGPGCYLSQCDTCHGYLAVDPIESKTAYGRAVDTECPGAPPHGPAERRDTMDEAASFTSLASEPVPGDPIIWQRTGGNPPWFDPETPEYMRRKTAREEGTLV